MKKSQAFGEMEFFLNIPYYETIRSTTFTTILKINRSSFLELLKQNSEEYVISI
jgi:CRP-like cAMP-binding protein